jgi:hypothetical protein
METTTDARYAVRCHRCNGVEHLIDGDGPLVCRPCIDMLGSIAADPHRADHRIVTALLQRHGDVLSLQRFPVGTGGDTEMRWTWGES